MNTQSIRQTVRDYILREFLPDEKPDAVQDSTPLITGGILDSISTIKLVSYLEEQFKVEFAAHEVGPDHLDSLNTIAKTVAAKLGGK